MAKKSKAKAKGGGKKPAAKRVVAKSAKPAKAAATTRAEAIVLRVTPGVTLKSLLSTCKGYKANVDSIVSKLREEIAFAVEKKHLDKGAFALLRKFDKMEAEKASELWHTLVRYMELTGVMAKIEAVGRLPLGDGPDDSEIEEQAGSDNPDDEAAEAEAQVAAEAKPKGKRNGKGKPALDPHPGIEQQPESNAAENVSRPQFGRPAGISGDELAEATGIEPATAH